MPTQLENVGQQCRARIDRDGTVICLIAGEAEFCVVYFFRVSLNRALYHTRRRRRRRLSLLVIIEGDPLNTQHAQHRPVTAPWRTGLMQIHRNCSSRPQGFLCNLAALRARDLVKQRNRKQPEFRPSFSVDSRNLFAWVVPVPTLSVSNS